MRVSFTSLANKGFSLIELLTIIAIIMVLGTLIIPNWSTFMARIEQARCMSNMRSIQAGIAAYLNDHKMVWPQGPGAESGQEWADFWLNTTKPYDVSERTWQCPTILRQIGLGKNPIPGTGSIHYVPTMFSTVANIAYRWPTQPWLIERANVHGNGSLICFTDGSIKTSNKVLAEQGVR